MSASGFIGAFGFLSGIVAAGAAFIAFPKAYAMTWPWLSTKVVSHYGPLLQENAWWIWSGILVLLIFGLVRCALFLLISAGGLALILKILFGRGRR